NEGTLWARDAAQAREIDAARENARYLPGIALPPQLRVDEDFTTVVAGNDLLVIATPTAGLRPTLQRLNEARSDTPLVWLCKGFELAGGCLGHQVVAEELPQASAGALSGPSFAEEVARGLPTALTVAGDAEFCTHVTTALHAASLRIYSSDDVVGVEVGGAVKNVLAIATGIVEAL